MNPSENQTENEKREQEEVPADGEQPISENTHNSEKKDKKKSSKSAKGSKSENDKEPEITETPEKNEENEEEKYAAPQIYVYTDGIAQIEVNVPEGVKLPYGTTLQAVQVPESSMAYEQAVQAVENANQDQQFAGHVFYDISFVLDGKEVQPEDGEVQVAIKFLTPVLSAEEGAAALENSDVVVSHISDKAVLSDVAANVQCTDTSVEAVNFQADSFSIYGISLLTENTEDGIFRDGTATVKLEI